MPDALGFIVAFSPRAPVHPRQLERVQLRKGREFVRDLLVKLLRKRSVSETRLACKLTGEGGWKRFCVDMTRRYAR